MARCVAEVIDTENFTVNSVAYQNLIVHICIAVQRIQENCYVPLDEERQERIRRSKEYRIAQKITERLNPKLCHPLSRPGDRLHCHPFGGQSSPCSCRSRSGRGGGRPGDQRGDLGSGFQMLDAVYEAFLFDFRSDLELRTRPAHRPPGCPAPVQHEAEKSALKGHQNGSPWPMPSPSLVLHPDGKRYGHEPKDDEVGYLALAFALAIERQNTELPKEHTDRLRWEGQRQLLHYRYRQEFGLVAPESAGPTFQCKKVDFKDIDYVFTTVPIQEKVPVPVQEVKYFLESAISRI